MIKNFPDLMENINQHIQESNKFWINTKRDTPTHIVIKLQKDKVKKKILKATGKK